jgi:hypothetical protein
MTEHQRPLTEPDAALTAALTSVNDAALTEPIAALGPSLAALTEPQKRADRAPATAPRCWRVSREALKKRRVRRPARRFFCCFCKNFSVVSARTNKRSPSRVHSSESSRCSVPQHRIAGLLMVLLVKYFFIKKGNMERFSESLFQ